MLRLIVFVLLLISLKGLYGQQLYANNKVLYVWTPEGITGQTTDGRIINLAFGAVLYMKETIPASEHTVCLIKQTDGSASYCVESKRLRVEVDGVLVEVEDTYLTGIAPFSLEKSYNFFNHFAESGQLGQVLSDSIHVFDAEESYRYVATSSGFQGYEFIQEGPAFRFELIFPIMTLRELFLITRAIYPQDELELSTFSVPDDRSPWANEETMKLTVAPCGLANNIAIQSYNGFSVLRIDGICD